MAPKSSNWYKINSASPIKALISTKSPLTSFTTLYLDGTLDWMISQRDALLAWTGQTLSLKPRILAKMVRFNVLAYTITKNLPLPYRFKSTSLRLEVPGISGLWRFLPDVKFFRSMRESTGWKFLSTMLFTIRTWSRRTIWGDRLFLQFQGPGTILLQTRASRISDILTSKDVNEIADTEPGAVQSVLSTTAQELKEAEQPERSTKAPTKMTYASVSKDGGVKFDKQGS
ncbi:Altered inheritance of mitochondria protein 24, mitochondrial [Thelotrema lepadinum]|nr:Altered inheritance of mitochondria protein 24, mitochondrial [Thelotrema lepadinum]